MTGTRSKGCSNCRHRKIKCDESRPICQRCVKANLECQGYQKPAVFIDDWKKRSNAASSAGRSIQKTEPITWQTGQLRVGPQMTVNGLRRDYYISFLTEKLFSQRKAENMQSWYALRLKDLPSPGLALDALITYFYGRYNRIADITLKGMAYYSKALISLRNDLQGQEAYSAGTLVTTTLLSMYEMIGYSSSGGWIHHAGGLGRLIQARGPESHIRGIGKSVFPDQRTLMISEAVLQKKRTFLSEDNWKTIPWSDDPMSKTPFDYLLDITADSASHLDDSERADTWSSGEKIRAFAAKLNHTIDQLDAWWRGWATKLVDRTVEVPIDPELDVSFDEEGPVFPTVIRYDGFWSCYVTVCYNATRIMLLQLLNRAERASQIGDTSIFHRTVEESPLPLSGITSDISVLAVEILRAIEFFETTSKWFLGTYCLLFPMRLAQQCLVPGSREARWLYNLPGKNLASYRRAAGDQDHSSALPTCGCMMIDSVVSNYQDSTY